MFDLRVPESLADMPGRFVGLCWDEDDMPTRTPRPKMTAGERIARRRARGRAEYWANRDAILARRKEARKRSVRVKQTPEQRAAQKAHYWATNRERINARRRKVGMSHKNETHCANSGPLTSQPNRRFYG